MPLPVLKIGAVVPPLTLPTLAGERVSRSIYRGRKHLVLVFLTPSEDARLYLQELTARADDIDAASGAVLGIVRAANLVELQACTANWAFSFPILCDTNGVVLARFLPISCETGAFIIDRYGELYYQALGLGVCDLPPASTIVDWLEAVDYQCSV